MEHHKRVAKYWRDSLVDKQFSQGKFKSSDLVKTFLLNDKKRYLRVNNKNVLQSLSSFEDNIVEISYIPFSFKKISSHNKHEKDYRPEILFPIILKVQVSENGFIYPIQNPVIPRDLLLPLDKEDFFIGNMDDYDLFVTKNDIPAFECSQTSEWEKYYSKNIEPQFQKELVAYLLEESIIDKKQTKDDFKKLIRSLTKNTTVKKGKISDALSKYNEEWSNTIEDKLTDDPEFNKAIESYTKKWSDYLKYVDKVLDKVVKSKEVFNGYQKTDSAYFTNGELDSSSKIIAVYEDIYTRERNPDLSLLRNYTTVEQENEIPIIDSGNFFSKRLGHNNNKYPLADAQRTAVSALMAARQGEIVPVNGPPGTGKTTMLLSVVACLWVENAVKETEPPVIIANSTNNQAVTNIIDAFAKDFSQGEGDFSGRWIDDVNSFGSYFVSSMRSADARQKGYITEDAVKEMETEDFYIKACQSFLEKSRRAFNNNITIEESVRKLHKLLKEKSSLLKDIEKTYANYHKLGEAIGEVLDFDYRNNEAITVIGKSLIESKKDIEIIEDKWERYLASESFFLSVLSFLPFVKKKRNLKAKIFAKENNFSKHLDIDSLDAERFIADIKNKREIVFTNTQQYDTFKKALNHCDDALNKLENDIDPNTKFIEIDKKADINIRFNMFLIATHYWEGRWLLEVEQLIEKGHLGSNKWSYRKYREDNWRRRMKITPCAVMTSYMLPHYFSFSRKINDNLKKDDYLYDFIDLLIVDEAGQVPAEVAGAGFSLAKKALIIGDTKQIPPISKITKSIDIGNLHKANLISKNQGVNQIDEDYKKLQSKGIASDGGSVMKISQNRSTYYPEKKLERGLYLYEHRRCYDNIIAFCNELCYKGVLKPMRGVAKNDAILPSMGYLNIEGKCRNISGSKQNELEAKVIAGWIITNYKKLRDAYNGEEIKDIVAVITPFREQSRKIAEYLKESKDKSIKDELSQITVGTVHSLQGAERKVVLFSPTYSIHNKGGFIDNDKSMLNVAVSRAKDSFLVFGDMSLFNRQSVSPTGILAKYLLEDENNELSYIHQYSKSFAREDLFSIQQPLRILTNFEEHDVFLKNIFSEATKRIVIISPWLIYSTIEKNGYDKLLSDKHVEITIYSDEKFNTYTQNKPDKKKEAEFHLTLNKLNEMGIDVRIKNNIHSKIVIKDTDTMCIGSFNWFSAQRGGQYCNTEHSIVYQGESAKDEIENVLKQLK